MKLHSIRRVLTFLIRGLSICVALGLLRPALSVAQSGAVETSAASKEKGRATYQAVPLIPRDVLFCAPEKTALQLSPDGQLVAYLAPDSGIQNVWVRSVGKPDDRAITRDRGRGIRNFLWGPGGRQLLCMRDTSMTDSWHIFSVPLQGGPSIDLTPIRTARAQIIALEPSHPEEILIGLNDRDPQTWDVYRVNLVTGERKLELQNDIKAMRWTADHQLRVRLAQVGNPDGSTTLNERRGDEWQDLLTWGGPGQMTSLQARFGGDDNSVYLTTNKGSSTTELRLLDLTSGETKVLASDGGADVTNILVDPISHQIQAVVFTRARHDWMILDPAIRKDFDALSKAHPGDFYVVDRDQADRTWLIARTEDKAPTVYYTYARSTRKETLLCSSRPKLDRQPLAEMKPIQYRSRDSVTIYGYLTTPPGVPAKNLPAVLLVHDGPWTRDGWEYNAEAQWLANRGYAVLQPNFRGSTGYGQEFTDAGDREWGGKQQDDLTDGVAWLVAQGIADPKKIGIFGRCYGGYAALCGLTGTPDLYACGVSISGPPNLVSYLKSLPPQWGPIRTLYFQRVGDPETDAQLLFTRSPLFAADKVRSPLFIVQGANDPRVRTMEVEQMRDLLKKAGNTVEYMEFPEETSGIARPENRMKSYTSIERFLATHLGGRFEPAP